MNSLIIERYKPNLWKRIKFRYHFWVYYPLLMLLTKLLIGNGKIKQDTTMGEVLEVCNSHAADKSGIASFDECVELVKRNWR